MSCRNWPTDHIYPGPVCLSFRRNIQKDQNGAEAPPCRVEDPNVGVGHTTHLPPSLVCLCFRRDRKKWRAPGGSWPYHTSPSLPCLSTFHQEQKGAILVEDAWLTIPRWRYTHELVVGAPDPHTYRLSHQLNAEDAFWADMELQEHTKYSIARHLERLHGWDRARLWNRRLNLLHAAVAQDLAPWDAGFVVPAAAAAAAPAAPAPAAPAPGAPVRGRGRGRGRGRRGRV